RTDNRQCKPHLRARAGVEVKEKEQMRGRVGEKKNPYFHKGDFFVKNRNTPSQKICEGLLNKNFSKREGFHFIFFFRWKAPSPLFF
ncbi:hypothetical protein, partial [Leptospira borgpetersenii]|uniref:hypothetical protein n=1 Tax=Leptospira borgpetersenii TaxID=174 RepID=UPI0027DAD629